LPPLATGGGTTKEQKERTLTAPGRKKSLGAASGGDDDGRSGPKSGIKSMFGGFLDMLSDKKKVEISTPYDPVHLTHVGFNVDTGEFTGLPKEWQQLLSDSGISKQEQMAHPQAVADIVAFYNDATKKEAARPGGEDDDVWQKFGGVQKAHPELDLPALHGHLQPAVSRVGKIVSVFER
jgi:hypothetical protein